MSVESCIPVVPSIDLEHSLLGMGYAVSEIWEQDYGRTEFFLTANTTGR